MKIIVHNVKCETVIGGKDNLLPFDLKKELDEYLMVAVKGSFYMEATRKGWDGHRHFFSSRGEFATGFLPMVVKFLMEELEVTPVIEDRRGELPYLKDEIVTHVGSEELRPNQVALIKKLNKYMNVGGKELYWPRGIFDAATNAGKTTIIAGITLSWANEPRCLFLTHSATVYADAVKRLKAVIPDVGEINSKKYAPGKKFTIAMAPTLANRIDKSMNALMDVQNYDVLYVDETHRFGSDEYSNLLQQIGAGSRIFVSGSPLDNDDKVKNMIIVGLSGSVIGKITKQELIQLGYSQRPIIHMHLNWPDGPIYEAAFMTYDEAKEKRIKFSEPRKKIITDILIEHRHEQCVVSFNDRDHGKWLESHFLDCPMLDNMEIAYVDGEMKVKAREEIYEEYRRGNINLLVSSMVLKEGANLPNIRWWIRTEAGKSRITDKQVPGRTERHDGIHDTVNIVDFFDVGKHISTHSRLRMKHYREQGFEIVKYYDKSKEKNLL